MSAPRPTWQAQPERFGDCLRAATPYHEALALRDVEGRPLGEGNAPAASRAGVELEWRACPYDDSRARVPGARMNVSALRQLTRRFRPLLGAVGWLREAYVRRTGCAAWTLPHLWTFGRIATLIPSYLVRRRVAPLADGELPVLVAAMFKSLAGVFLCAHRIVVDAVLEGRAGDAAAGQVDLFAADDPAAALTAEELVTLANLLGVLAQGEAVCAGPPPMIDELLEVVVSGGASDAEADEGARELAAILGDVDDFFGFAARMNAITIARDLLRHELRSAHARLHDQAAVMASLPTAMIEHVVRALGAHDHAALMPLYQPGLVSGRRTMTRWLESILALADRGRSSPAVRARLVGRAADPDVAPLLAWLAHDAQVDHPALGPMAEALLACVAHERRVLAALTELQAEVNAQGGQPAPSAALDGAATERVAGLPSFAVAFAAVTRLRVIHHAEGLVLETATGTASFTLP